MPKYIYLEYCFKICIIFAVINCVSLSKASVIYCNSDQLSWRDSMKTCINVGGTPVSGDLYSSNNELLRNGQRVWTSDYAVATKFDAGRAPELCGVRTYNSSVGFCGMDFFLSCDSHFLYICCPSGQGGSVGPACIRNGTWEEAMACTRQRYAVGIQDGIYWTGAAKTITQQQVRTLSDLSGEGTQIYHCGFIDTDGQFTRTTSCYQNMSSLCSFGNFKDHSSHHMSDSKTRILVGLGVGAVALVAATAVISLILRRKGVCCRREEVHKTETNVEENSYEQIQNQHYANIQSPPCKDDHLYLSIQNHNQKDQ